MKHNDVEKLKFFLSGIASRMTENSAYFISCAFSMRSGAKTLTGTLTLTENGYLYTFGGKKETVTPEGFSAALVRDARNYDGMTLDYTERGAVITVEADERGVRSRRNAQNTPKEETAHDMHLLSDRDYILKPSEAAPLLQAIGLLSADGKLKNDKIRKFNQIDHFLERVKPLIDGLEDETVQILDCACGKSYLSFAMNYFVRDVLHRKCFVTGVDISEGVIRESKRIASELGYRNMEFLCADLRDYQVQKPSLVISLHACDIATDMALGLAIRSKARAIACVPCCHKELLDTYKAPGVDAFTRHGALRARLNDVLTDGLRTLKLESAGYDVSVTEYVSPVDTPKNLLITARKTAEENKAAEKEFREMCTAMGVYPAVERFSMCLK